MGILRVAKAPTVVIEPDAKVIDAIRAMKRANVGAVAVVAETGLVGMFSERDVMLRVVLEKKDPDRTNVQEVMTRNVVTISKDTTSDDAVKMMWERHIRHLPVIAADGTVEGVVEIRNLFHERLEALNRELDSLESYIAADGVGG
jgi:CBS domain-containing protein